MSGNRNATRSTMYDARPDLLKHTKNSRNKATKQQTIKTIMPSLFLFYRNSLYKVGDAGVSLICKCKAVQRKFTTLTVSESVFFFIQPGGADSQVIIQDFGYE